MQAMACAVLMESPYRNRICAYILLAYFKMFVLCYILIFICTCLTKINLLTYLLVHIGLYGDVFQQYNTGF